MWCLIVRTQSLNLLILSLPIPLSFSLQYLQMKWPMLDVPGTSALKDPRSTSSAHMVGVCLRAGRYTVFYYTGIDAWTSLSFYLTFYNIFFNVWFVTCDTLLRCV